MCKLGSLHPIAGLDPQEIAFRELLSAWVGFTLDYRKTQSEILRFFSEIHSSQSKLCWSWKRALPVGTSGAGTAHVNATPAAASRWQCLICLLGEVPAVPAGFLMEFITKNKCEKDIEKIMPHQHPALWGRYIWPVSNRKPYFLVVFFASQNIIFHHKQKTIFFFNFQDLPRLTTIPVVSHSLLQ